MQHGLELTDEFDTIETDLAPYWGLSPAQIRSRHEELRSTQSSHILSLVIKGGQVSDEEGPADTTHWPINKLYYALVSDIAHLVPDMKMAINLHDNPAIFVSYEERERLIKAGRAGVCKACSLALKRRESLLTQSDNLIDADDADEIKLPFEEVVKSSAFSFIDLRSACPPETPGREFEADPFGYEHYPNVSKTDLLFRLPDHQGGFIHDIKKQMDVCYNPSLSTQHGGFLQPRIRLPLKRNRLYPLFSWSTHRRASDITIPTTYRFDFSKRKPHNWTELIPQVACEYIICARYTPGNGSD